MAYATLAQLKAYLGIRNSDTFTGAAATDLLTLTDTAIDWTTGEQVVLTAPAAPAALPTPLAAATIYYVIYVSPLTIQLATTEANADAGTEIVITVDGSGTIAKAVTDDDLLEDLIDRAEKAIDTYTRRVFEADTDTRYFERRHLDDSGFILHMDRDLLTITTLTNGDSAGTAIPNTEYWLTDANGGRNYGPPYHGIRLKIDSTYSWEFDTDYWVSVAGTWGYSTTAPDDIVHATLRLAAYYYHQKDAQVFDTTAMPEQGVITVPQGIPRDVQRILDPYKRQGIA